ncbi:hypothetical protein [Amycolatopsis sp. cmx-4-61]|uniref:hypothetical protein n=1 Tax=Amycolatopsis sp. cmx-4-61 TaxID=2790937 RepID=UPI00397BB447
MDVEPQVNDAIARQKAEPAMDPQSASELDRQPSTFSWADADELPDTVSGALVASATVTAAGVLNDVEITWDHAATLTPPDCTDAALSPDEEIAAVTTASRVRADAAARTRAAAVAVAHQVQHGAGLRAALQALTTR